MRQRPPRRPRRPPQPAPLSPCEAMTRKRDANSSIRGAVAGVLREIIAEELDGKEFVNTRGDVKKFRVLGAEVGRQTHETKFKAQFVAPRERLNFTIPSLTGGLLNDSAACMVIDVSLIAPLKGSVAYKIVNVAEASTNFKADAHVTARVEVQFDVQMTRGGLRLLVEPNVKNLGGQLSGLEFSNQIADWFGGNIQAAANENIQANAATYTSIIQRALERAVRNTDLSVNLADLIAGL